MKPLIVGTDEFLSEFPVCAPVAAHLSVLPMFASELADTRGSKHCSSKSLTIGIRPNCWGLGCFSTIQLTGRLESFPLKRTPPKMPGLLVPPSDSMEGIEPSLGRSGVFRPKLLSKLCNVRPSISIHALS